MGVFAKNTSVSVDRSRSEIERTLARYGAIGFAYGTSGGRAMIQFNASARRIMFVLELPNPSSDEFSKTPSRGRQRSADQTILLWEQACRQKWRALCLAIKAKLEAVESGISSFEDEFMAHIVLPNGKTVGQVMRPQIENSYSSGTMPPLLGYGGTK